MNDASMLQMTLESEQNAQIRRSIINLLQPVFGEDNFSVAVNTTVDVSHTWEELVRYYLPEYAEDGSTNGKGIIGKRVFSGELQYDDGNTMGGVPGTTTNADISEYVENADAITGNESGLNVSGETEYRTSQDTTQRESNAGTVTDCMVAVTINAQPGSINQPDWVAAVARAAGIDEEMEDAKVSVIATPFYVEPVEPGTSGGGSFSIAGLPDWVLYAAIAGLALFLLILILIMVLRSEERRVGKECRSRWSRKKRKAQEEALLAEQEAAAAALAAEQAAALAAETGAPEDGEPEPPKTGANIMEIHTERSMELRRDVRAFAENNPEVAAYMIKSWLKGDDDDNA